MSSCESESEETTESYRIQMGIFKAHKNYDAKKPGSDWKLYKKWPKDIGVNTNLLHDSISCKWTIQYKHMVVTDLLLKTLLENDKHFMLIIQMLTVLAMTTLSFQKLSYVDSVKSK